MVLRLPKWIYNFSLMRGWLPKESYWCIIWWMKIWRKYTNLHINYKKLPAKIEELCSILQECQKAAHTLREQYELSFNAHLNLVTIHPWVDGNGRTARLLMDYIQFCYHLFPSKIFMEDRVDYMLALQQSQNKETNLPFLNFMATQLGKSLSLEIERYNVSLNKGFSLMF